jgi:hypothetical protein
VDYTTQELAAFLNRAWNNAASGANTLPDQLIAEQQAALNFIATVGSLSHVSKNSTSQAYGGYNPGNLTVRQIVSIWTRLIEIHDDIKVKIVDAFTEAVIVIPADYDFDIDVFAQMKNFLRQQEMPRMPDIRDNRVPLARTVVYEVSGGPP